MEPRKILFLGKGSKVQQIFKSFHNKNCITLIKNATDGYKFLQQVPNSFDLVLIDSDSLKDDCLSLIQLIRKNSRSFVKPYIIVVNSHSNFALKAGADVVYHQLPDEEELKPFLEVSQPLPDLDAIIGHAINMIKIKDNLTFEHCRSTAMISSVLAALYLQSHDKKDVQWHQNLKIAALLHDTGKILIPESILQKPSRLSEKEYNMIKNHTKLGSELFSKFSDIYPKCELFSVCAEVCLYHHERFDGSGYPKGLKADQIPLEARIVSIADVFDALTSNRYYRNAYSFDEALQIMQNEEQKHFDPQLLDLFLKNADLFCQIKLENKS